MITSLQNEQVKHIVSLHTNKGRKEYGQYLIEGKRFVNEAFLRKAKINKIFYCSLSKPATLEEKTSEELVDLPGLIRQAKILGIQAEEVSEAVMRKMSSTEEPQGILAIGEKPLPLWEDLVIGDSTILLILDNLQDPGNLGTILRTALAADVCQIILTRGTVDLFNPKALRSSMGAIFSQLILTDKTPEEIVSFCNMHHITLTVSTMEGSSIFAEDTSANYPLALVIGNEAFGPSKYLLEKAKKKYAIPMFNNVESLNAAMAAGIFLYELRRQVQFL